MIRLITEFALEQKEIKRKLIDITPKIIEHISYIVLSPDNVNRNHWTHEIYAFLHSIDFMRKGKKLPKADFIYSNTFKAREDYLESRAFREIIVPDLCDEEHIEVPEDLMDAQHNIEMACSFYFSWLSSQLSEDGAVSKASVKDRIDKIIETLNKYD